MAAIKRPTPEQYADALNLYRAGFTADAIADRLGIDPEVVDRLEHDGWPARGDKEALVSFRARVTDRIVRIRNSELDWAQSNAESAAATAAMRAQSAEMASKLEHAILASWVRKVSPKMIGGPPADPADLCVSKNVLDNLRALRNAQDPGVDVKVADLFRHMSGNTGEEDRGDDWSTRIVELAGMTREEQEEYSRTGEIPKRQRELFDEAG